MVIDSKDTYYKDFMKMQNKDKNEFIKNNNPITLSGYFDIYHVNFMTHPEIEIHYYTRLDNGCDREIIKQLDLLTALNKYGSWELSDGTVEEIKTEDGKTYYKAWLIKPRERELELEYIKDDRLDKPDKPKADDKQPLYADWYLRMMKPEREVPEISYPEYDDEGLMY